MILAEMSVRNLEKKVGKLDSYLAKFNRLMSEAPEEFCDAVEGAFIGMTDRFKIYEQALKKKSSVRRRDDSDSDSGDDEDGSHGHGLRASATPASYSNKRIKRESPEPLLPRNNGKASHHDATRHAPSSAIFTAGPFARNKQATNTAETGAALSRDNNFNFNFTFRHPPPTHNDRVWVPAIPSSGQPRSPPSLDGAFAWPRPAQSTAHGIGNLRRIVGNHVMRPSGVPAAEVERVKEEEMSELEYLEDADEDGEYDEENEGMYEEYDEDEEEYEDDEEDEAEDDEDSDEEFDDEDEDGDTAGGGNGPSRRLAGDDGAEDDDDRDLASSNGGSSENEERGAGRPSYCHPYHRVYPAEHFVRNVQQTRAGRAFAFVPPPPHVAPAPTAPAAPAPAFIPALAAAAIPNAPAMYPQDFHLPPLVAVPPPAVRVDAAPEGGQPATRGLHVSTTLPPLRTILREYLNLGAAPAHAAPEMAPEVPPVPPNTPQPVTTSRDSRTDLSFIMHSGAHKFFLL